MKILVVCQYYYPEPFRISDICEELVKAGHEVFVVTGVPNYPEGKIYREYKHRKNRDEVINGVKVHRCFTIGRKNNFFFRFLNYYSYSISASLYASKIREHFDVVFVNQLSPVMMAKPAIAYKKKHKTKMILYCFDLWPESLTLGGIKKGGLLYRAFHKISSKIYHSADKILISSNSFSKYFEKEFGITDTLYVPQYAEELFDTHKCHKIANDTVDLMFAGNVGAAQSVETIVYAASKTKDIPNLYWHIVGDGSELEHIKQLSNSLELKNIIFHGRKPIGEMPRYYSLADAMLVTMKKSDILSTTLPGKVQTYMAAGKPVLGAIDGETADTIKKSGCGMCCAAEDPDALAEMVREYIKQRSSNRFAENAFNYYTKTFSKQSALRKIFDLLETENEDL